MKKIKWLPHKKKKTGKTKIEDPKMTHVTTSTEFSTVGSKQILRKTVSLANGGNENWILTCKSIKIDPHHLPRISKHNK